MSVPSDPLPSSEISQARLFFRILRHRVTSTPVRVPVVHWRHYRLREPDVLLASYPRSGSTWLRFVLYEILSGESSSFDRVNGALRGLTDCRHGARLLPNQGRFIGTHEPYYAAYQRAVYLVRDVRDVALSEFAFEKNLGIARPTFDLYLDEMLFGRKRHGSWQHHVESWLDSPLAARGDLLFLQYEKLRQDSVNVFLELLDFLKVSRSRDAVERALAHNTLEQMREKEDRLYRQQNYSSVPRRPIKAVRPGGRFIRTGSVGGWRERLSREQLHLIELHAAHVLARLGYPVETLAPAEVSSTA